MSETNNPTDNPMNELKPLPPCPACGAKMHTIECVDLIGSPVTAVVHEELSDCLLESSECGPEEWITLCHQITERTRPSHALSAEDARLVEGMREAAGKATKGEWFYDDIDYIFADRNDPKMVAEIRGAGFGLPMDDNAKHIALANPSNVLRLISLAHSPVTDMKQFLDELFEQPIFTDLNGGGQMLAILKQHAYKKLESLSLGGK